MDPGISDSQPFTNNTLQTMKSQYKLRLSSGAAKRVERLIYNRSVVILYNIEGSRCFLEQNTLSSLLRLRNSWFQEHIRA